MSGSIDIVLGPAFSLMLGNAADARVQVKVGERARVGTTPLEDMWLDIADAGRGLAPQMAVVAPQEKALYFRDRVLLLLLTPAQTGPAPLAIRPTATTLPKPAMQVALCRTLCPSPHAALAHWVAMGIWTCTATTP